jgi:ATP-dependent DNA helicase RecQ
LERVGLVIRHPDAGRDMRIEMLPPPRTSRADLEALLESRRRHAEERIEKMAAYVEGTGCRHVAISRHFGQELEPCGSACDRCLGTAEEGPPVMKAAPPGADQVPDIGRAIMTTIQSLPFAMGRTGIAKVLMGAADSPVGKDRCESYGILAGCTRKSLMEYMDELIEEGLLSVNLNDEYRRVFITSEGRTALEEEREIRPNPYRSTPSQQRADRSSPRVEIEMTEDEEDLFERLRAWRRIEADRAELPPYVIFHDATLRAIARTVPRTAAEMGKLPGIGPSKMEKYGDAVLELLNNG